jgi:putative ubiquitin-RnfH superfamily antitoxin RatB of RatAB toxin-antitoxin module
MAEAPGALAIEVCWIGVDPPLRVALTLPTGSTVAQALQAIRLADRIGEPLDTLAVAVFGQAAAPGDPLYDGDRVELLPPLTVDPKIARQRRAEHRRRLSGERRWTPDRARPAPASAAPGDA